jgi:orotate phosphoribosyltransferase
MKAYQREFIELAIEAQALKFGDFTLKSGRVSPYFFNAGQFQTSSSLSKLGQCYADALIDAKVEIDMLFGPAYKGIPLVSTTGIALYEKHGRDLPYCYNRKEAKDHGEGGSLVGAPLQGKVAIIDDVITAGTAIREVLAMIEPTEAKVSAIIVGLDRQERGTSSQSAIAELQAETKVPVLSIIKLNDVIEFLQDVSQDSASLDAILQYRKDYGSEN